MTTKEINQLANKIAEKLAEKMKEDREEWIPLPRAMQMMGVSRTKMGELIKEGFPCNANIRPYRVALSQIQRYLREGFQR